MAKTRRAYTGASVSSTTSSAIAASGTTSFTVSAATNWPYGSDPFYVVLSPGTASEEKVLVTRTNTGDTTINIASDAVRGQDGTSAVSHDSGATVYPVFTAVDADEANELAAMWESKGDIVSHGASTFARLAVGADDTVLIADSSAGSGLAWGQVGTANIAADAVTNAKIAAGAVGNTELGSDAVSGDKIADDAVDTEHIADASLGRKEMFPVGTVTWSSGTVGSPLYEANLTLTEGTDVEGLISIGTVNSNSTILFSAPGLYYCQADGLSPTASGTAFWKIVGTVGFLAFNSVSVTNNATFLVSVSATSNSGIYLNVRGFDSNFDGVADTATSWSAGTISIYKMMG